MEQAFKYLTSIVYNRLGKKIHPFLSGASWDCETGSEVNKQCSEESRHRQTLATGGWYTLGSLVAVATEPAPCLWMVSKGCWTSPPALFPHSSRCFLAPLLLWTTLQLSHGALLCVP